MSYRELRNDVNTTEADEEEKTFISSGPKLKK